MDDNNGLLDAELSVIEATLFHNISGGTSMDTSDINLNCDNPFCQECSFCSVIQQYKWRCGA